MVLEISGLVAIGEGIDEPLQGLFVVEKVVANQDIRIFFLRVVAETADEVFYKVDPLALRYLIFDPTIKMREKGGLALEKLSALE
jgi:hypothetical protein